MPRGKKAATAEATEAPATEAAEPSAEQPFLPPEPKAATTIGTGTLKDKTPVEFRVDDDGKMTVTAPERMAGMELVRRNDGTRTTPGTLKLVGKPPKA